LQFRLQEGEGGGEVVSFGGQLTDELLLTIKFFLVSTALLHTVARENGSRAS